MKKVQASYNLKINLEIEEAFSDPYTIEQLVKEQLDKANAKFVIVECIDFDINDLD